MLELQHAWVEVKYVCYIFPPIHSNHIASLCYCSSTCVACHILTVHTTNWISPNQRTHIFSIARKVDNMKGLTWELPGFSELCIAWRGMAKYVVDLSGALCTLDAIKGSWQFISTTTIWRSLTTVITLSESLLKSQTVTFILSNSDKLPIATHWLHHLPNGGCK